MTPKSTHTFALGSFYNFAVGPKVPEYGCCRSMLCAVSVFFMPAPLTWGYGYPQHAMRIAHHAQHAMRIAHSQVGVFLSQIRTSCVRHTLYVLSSAIFD